MCEKVLTDQYATKKIKLISRKTTEFAILNVSESPLFCGFRHFLYFQFFVLNRSKTVLGAFLRSLKKH